MPFRLALENRERVILGTDAMPRLGFVFQEGEDGEEAGVKKDTLMKTLSTGEKKALYVLNIIFEVEARRKLHKRPCLFSMILRTRLTTEINTLLFNTL